MNKVDLQMSLKRKGKKFQRLHAEKKSADIHKLARYGWSKRHIASFIGVEVAIINWFLKKQNIDIQPLYQYN